MKRDSIEALLSTWGKTLFLQREIPSLLSPLPSSLNTSNQSIWVMEAELLRPDTGIRVAHSAGAAIGNALLGIAARRRLRADLSEHKWILRAMNGQIDGRAADPVLRLAACWNKDERMRLRLHSLFLSIGADVETVGSALGLDPEVLACYEELYFNVIDRRDEPLYITSVSIGRNSAGAAGRHEAAWSVELPGAAVHLPMSVTLGRLGLSQGYGNESGNDEAARLTRALCMALLEPASVPLRSSALRPVLELHRKNMQIRNSDVPSPFAILAEELKKIPRVRQGQPSDPEEEVPNDQNELGPEDEHGQDALSDHDLHGTQGVLKEEPRFPIIDLTALGLDDMETSGEEIAPWMPLDYIGGQGGGREVKDGRGWFAESGVDRLWRLLVLAGENTELRSSIADKLPPWLLEAADSAIRGDGGSDPLFGVVRRAVELHHYPVSRHLIQASLICRDASVENAAAFLRLPTAVVQAYAVLFFDLGGPMDRPWLRAHAIGRMVKGMDPAGNSAIDPRMSRLMKVAHRCSLEQLEDLSGCAKWMLDHMETGIAATRLADLLYELSRIQQPSVRKAPKDGLTTFEWDDAYRLLRMWLPDETRYWADSLEETGRMLMESEEWKQVCETNTANRLAMTREDAGELPGSGTGNKAGS